MVTNILNDKKWSDNYVFSSAVFYAGNNNSYITYSDFENTKVIYVKIHNNICKYAAKYRDGDLFHSKEARLLCEYPIDQKRWKIKSKDLNTILSNYDADFSEKNIDLISIRQIPERDENEIFWSCIYISNGQYKHIQVDAETGEILEFDTETEETSADFYR